MKVTLSISQDQLEGLQREAAVAARREDRSVSAQLRVAVDMYLHRLTKRRARKGLGDDDNQMKENE